MSIKQKIDSLPIHHSLRVFLEYILSSNPLPYWLDYHWEIDFSGVTRKLHEKSSRYLNKSTPVNTPLEIIVPNKRGSRIKWLIPSINDQIILHSCMSVLAPTLHEEVLDQRVFSYCFINDPHQFRPFRNQLDSWIEFQNETINKLENYKFMLQLDLKSSFASINRSDFFIFLREYTGKNLVIDLLQYLIQGFDDTGRGIPMVNDSLFFLGNAYLSRVDRIIGKYLDNFIRFVDDYRLFSNSRNNLKKCYEKLSQDLANHGFLLNESKVKLGSKEEYFKAISMSKKTDPINEDYSGGPIFRNVADPEKLIILVEAAILNPERYLTIGYGRLLLDAFRRMRVNAIGIGYDYPGTAHYIFVDLLKKSEIPQKAIELSKKYLKEKNETWRLVWLLYLMEDFPGLDEVEKFLKEIHNYGKAPILINLWKYRLMKKRDMVKEDIGLFGFHQYDFDLHEHNYLEQGVKLYGGGK